METRPEKPEQLVKQIASFKAVIAGRFHANIIATSLGIPSVALVWNEKMRAFSELIGCPERYVGSPETLQNPAEIIRILETAMAEGYDEKRIEKYKKKTLRTIKNILK